MEGGNCHRSSLVAPSHGTLPPGFIRLLARLRQDLESSYLGYPIASIADFKVSSRSVCAPTFSPHPITPGQPNVSMESDKWMSFHGKSIALRVSRETSIAVLVSMETFSPRQEAELPWKPVADSPLSSVRQDGSTTPGVDARSAGAADDGTPALRSAGPVDDDAAADDVAAPRHARSPEPHSEHHHAATGRSAAPPQQLQSSALARQATLEASDCEGPRRVESDEPGAEEPGARPGTPPHAVTASDGGSSAGIHETERTRCPRDRESTSRSGRIISAPTSGGDTLATTTSNGILSSSRSSVPLTGSIPPNGVNLASTQSRSSTNVGPTGGSIPSTSSCSVEAMDLT